MPSSSHASTSTAFPVSLLQQLVQRIVPELAPPLPGQHVEDEDEEDDRKERLHELVSYCSDILRSRISDPGPSSSRTLTDETKKRLLASSSSSGTDRAVRFNNLWRRVEASNILTTPTSHLQFLLSLSSLGSTSYSAPPTFTAPLPSSSSSAPTLKPLGSLREPDYDGLRPDSRASSSGRNGPSRRPKSPSARAAPPPLRHQPSREEDAPGWKGKGKSKADVLRGWMAEKGQPMIPDALLLRDSLYLLQGIDGRFVKFLVPVQDPNHYLRPGVDPDAEEEPFRLVFEDDPKLGTIPIPTRTVMMSLAEIGWLCRNVEGFVKRCQEEGRDAAVTAGGGGNAASTGPKAAGSGLVQQSLCHFLQTQLTAYYHLVSILETQMTSGSSEPSSDPSSSGGETILEGSGLTLMRLGVWTREVRLKMRLMSLMVEDCRTSQGGALVSLIHSYTENGDPFARGFTDAVLEEVSKPFFDSLQRWIFQGELHDPYSEFFVRLNPDLADRQFVRQLSSLGVEDPGFEDVGGGSRRGGGGGGGGMESHELWERKYLFRKEMLPSFVSEEFGRKIFSTGKSLNFIRYSCHDSDWIATRAKLENAGRVLKYSDIAGLERSIDAAYEIASRRLLEVFFDKFMLMDHLRALKQYLMLGRGDFVDLLMESLASQLSGAANHLYRHQLTAQLESAVRGSNAQFDPPDVRRRLDARMLPFQRGEIGWDCFLLEYKVDAPIDTILDPEAMQGYSSMFIHLWKLKRVENALSGNWLRLTTGGRMKHRSIDTRQQWHHCRVVHAEMVHFIRQLQAFYQLEVIECSWQAFEELIAKNDDGLDGLMEAHKEYIGRLTSRILLSMPRHSKGETPLLQQVQDAFKVILAFKDSTEMLYRHTLEQEVQIDSRRDGLRGVFTQPSSSGPPLIRSEQELSRIRAQIREQSTRFQGLVNAIVASAASHPDPEIKLLAIRCSYNAFYQLKPVKERRGAPSRGDRTARSTA